MQMPRHRNYSKSKEEESLKKMFFEKEKHCFGEKRH